MDLERLLSDYHVDFVRPGEHARTTEGWINLHCPFCVGKVDYHLGVNVETGACHCWRCGPHALVSVLSKATGLSILEIKSVIRKYEGVRRKVHVTEPRVAIRPLKLPQPTIKLNQYGRRYLRTRRFDPDTIEEEWGVLQTGPISSLDLISYGNRIVIPIYWNGKMVSFQTRDITGKSDKKYIACPSKREKVKHAHIVYGQESVWQDTDTLIVVEGVLDVWRLGPYSVGTFGTSINIEQVLSLSRLADKFIILYDTEKTAQEQARKLAVKLRTLGKRTSIATLDDGDPADLKQAEADKLVKDLLV